MRLGWGEQGVILEALRRQVGKGSGVDLGSGGGGVRP